MKIGYLIPVLLLVLLCSVSAADWSKTYPVNPGEVYCSGQDCVSLGVYDDSYKAPTCAHPKTSADTCRGMNGDWFAQDFDSPAEYSCQLKVYTTDYGYYEGDVQTREVVKVYVNGAYVGTTKDHACNSGAACWSTGSYYDTFSAELEEGANTIKFEFPYDSVGVRKYTFECEAICQDECSSGQQECLDYNTYRVCENYDSDPCLEWRSVDCSPNQVCSGGYCVEECQDECEWGERACYDSDTYKECGNFDSDPCTEWRRTDCGLGQVCSGGFCRDGCQNECSYRGYRECAGNGYRICDYYDLDSCLDWSSVTNCGPNQVCSNGYCSDTCQDECSYGQRECLDGDTYGECGNFDSDPCTEWRNVDCGSNQVCEGGYCEIECEKGYLDEYRCDGRWRQRRYQYENCDKEWKNWEYCSQDCEDDECVDCDPGWGDDYRCRGSWLQREYVEEDCDETWRNWQYCPQGCYGDECRDTPPPRYYCGDGICNDGETCSNCPTDCGICPPVYYCGDGICSAGETCSSCPQDCGICPPRYYCGDGICSAGETCSNCPQDCGLCNYCGDGICNAGETCSSCPQDCGSCQPYCGDGTCNAGESCSSCPQDCGVCRFCGDGVCSGGETCSSCPSDCGPCAYCGDKICDSSESCSSCPYDCGECLYCGDGLCSAGETCSSCSQDCGSCELCGDGYCTGSESCQTCPFDCGLCTIVCGVQMAGEGGAVATACIELTGKGTNAFNLTIWNEEEYEAMFEIGLAGDASRWAIARPSSILIPGKSTGLSIIYVTIPDGTPHGLYNLTARVTSGGSIIDEKLLFVSVTEEDEGPAVAITPQEPGPAGAFLVGGMDVLWVAIILGIVINIILVAVLLHRVFWAG